MEKIRKKYFQHRLLGLGLVNDREELGEREVQTLVTMMAGRDSGFSLENKCVVDLGCGDRYLEKALRERGGSYYGVDINQCDLECEAIPLGEDSQDIAVCLALIEHLRDASHFLSEVIRVLRPGGVIWLSTPNIEVCKEKFWRDPTHVHPYTRESLRALLEMMSFEEVLITPNYRCKPRHFYKETEFNFLRSHYLMPFSGRSRLPIPSILKGGCTGIFALASKPLLR